MLCWYPRTSLVSTISTSIIMKCLIVLALAAVAYATNPVVPADTPEVAAAKAAHAVEWSRAAGAAAYPYSAYHYGAYPYSYGAYPYNYGAYPYSSWAVPTVLPSGHLADTPEVSAAKAAHFAEHAKAGGVVPYSAAYPYAYSAGYPYAVPTVLPSGHLADTPEVSAAKAAHFAEHAKAGGAYHYGAYPYSYGAYPYSYGAYPYSSWAAPAVLPSGHLADTPEVAAAKVAHFAEVAKAQAQA